MMLVLQNIKIKLNHVTIAFAAVCASLALTVSISANNFFVSTTGSPGGNGSLTNSWDLATVFGNPPPSAIKPGDTVWIRGGIYAQYTPYCLGYQSWLTGTSNAPIIIRSYPGERAILQQPTGYTNSACTAQPSPNVLLVVGSYAWYWGLEIRGTNTTRVINVSGSNPTFSQLPLFTSLGVGAPGVKLIDLVVRDTAGGYGLFAAATNCESYGCLIYNNGWDAPDRGHGHGIYCQNLNGQMHFSDNIIFTQFGLGFHGYTEGQNLKHFLVERNAVFNNGRIAQYPDPNVKEQVLFGGGPPIQDLNFINNYLYLPLDLDSFPLRLDYAANSNDNVVVANNYVAGGSGPGYYLMTATDYQSVIFTNNTMYTTNGSMLLLQTHPANRVDSNTYYGNGGANFNDGSTAYTFSAWKAATGYDSNSTYLANTVPPNKVIVNPNAYEPKRANIIVYNWANSNNVNVDVSSVLSSGDVYEVRNAQDFFAPSVLTGTYSGAALSLPMTNLTVATPNGWTNAAAIPTTGTKFNVFVLIGATPPQIISTSMLSNGSFQLQFKGSASNGNYTVEASTDLVSWVSLGFPTNAPAGSGLYQFTEPKSVGTKQFYKIKVAY